MEEQQKLYNSKIRESGGNVTKGTSNKLPKININTIEKKKIKAFNRPDTLYTFICNYL